MNPQLAQAAAAQQQQPAQDDSRTDAEKAGYVELEGAQKDSDCSVVNVPGGVSSKAGCCNLWDGAPGAQAFSCGTCTKMTKGQGQNQDATAGADKGATPAPAGPAQPQGM